MRYRTLGWLFAAAAVLSAGCSAKNEPATGINFYRSHDSDIRRISRVVLVDLSEDLGRPEISERMTASLQEALLKPGLFHVDIVPAGHPDLRDLDLTKREPYTMQELAAIRKSLECDAILFGRVTSYRPYPGTQIGLFLRLVDLADGRLVWAVDDVWDTTNRKLAERMQKYYFDFVREGYKPADSEMLVMSTAAFQQFVSWEVVQTMDPHSPYRMRETGRWRPLRRIGRQQEEFWLEEMPDNL
jgi:hypothetical protein